MVNHLALMGPEASCYNRYKYETVSTPSLVSTLLEDKLVAVDDVFYSPTIYPHYHITKTENRIDTKLH